MRFVLEHCKHERDIQSECPSRHDECVEASRKEAAEANDKWGKKVAKLFGKLSTTVKIALVVVIVVALVGFFGFILPSMLDNDETQYLTTSDLKSAVDIDSLSTVDYTYHGIVEKHGRFLWMNRVDYRVKYEAHIRASYTMSDIQFGIDKENKVVTAYLPKAQVGEPQLDNSKFGYLPENATADMKDVLSLCRKDAADEVDKKEIKKQADASLRDTVKALTMPLIEDEYELDFKPLTDYKGEADSNA